jgi:DNA-directed RNA polymerase subunit M/transcription elongation factor TFIIS
MEGGEAAVLLAGGLRSMQYPPDRVADAAATFAVQLEKAIAGMPPDHAKARRELFLKYMLAPCGPNKKVCILGEIAMGKVDLQEIVRQFPFEQFTGAAVPPPASAPRAPLRDVPLSPGPTDDSDPRRAIVQMFHNALAASFNAITSATPPTETSPSAPVNIAELAQKVEVGVYNYVIRSTQLRGGNVLRSWDNPTFVSYYSARAATVNTYLDVNSSMVAQYGMRLATALFAGDIQPAQVGGMTEEDLCPEGFEYEVQTVSHRKQQKVEKRVTQLWKCPNCKSRSSTSREVHDRSLDEPPSVYCTCTVCHIEFKGA